MQVKTHLVILILMVLASVIVLNQVNQPSFLVPVKAETKNADKSQAADTSEEAYVLQANVAINSSTTITLHQELYQIREIILDEVDDPQPVHEVNSLTESDHFKTLFRKVISPNAP